MFYTITRMPSGGRAEGRQLFDLMSIGGADGIIEDINEMGKWFAEVTARRADSTEFFILLTAALIEDNTGKIGMTFSISDISMRKSAEIALRESREALKNRNEIMEKDMQIAQLVQRELIPSEAPVCSFLNIAFSYIPLEKVGGDIFSFFPTREKSMGVFIGDVTGHGVAAALFHSLIQSATENIGRKYSSTPSEYMNRLNNELTGRMTSYFISGIYGSFSRSDGSSAVNFTFSNGGHPAPVIIRKDGRAELFGAGGTLLGLIPDYKFPEESVTLFPGDRVFLYTDGLPESSNAAGSAVGFDEKLADFIKAGSAPTIKDTIDAVVEQIRKFSGSRPMSDDLLIIGIEVRS
jgi:serine phosphatase RsbU (regulator of sigma subunit)